MAGELFKAMAGVSIVHIPYKGSAGARTDVLGGQVDMMFDAIPTMTEHIKAGKVKALATTGKTRSAVMPDVPTIAEAGVPGYEATIWLGLMAPKGTPPAIVDRLNAETRQDRRQPRGAPRLDGAGRDGDDDERSTSSPATSTTTSPSGRTSSRSPAPRPSDGATAGPRRCSLLCAGAAKGLVQGAAGALPGRQPAPPSTAGSAPSARCARRCARARPAT